MNNLGALYDDGHGVPQDYAQAQSWYEKAAAAVKDGRLAEEIVPVNVPQRRGDPIVVDTYEGVRPGTTAESLSKLKPAFDKEGTITAGNDSQISDGGAAGQEVQRAQQLAAPGTGRGGGRAAGEQLRLGHLAGEDQGLQRVQGPPVGQHGVGADRR